MPKVRKRPAKPNPVSEVQLRQRSTPYDFAVWLSSQTGRSNLYRGSSWRFAHSAYWQAVNLVRHLSHSAVIQVDLTEDGDPYGGFVTEIENGGDKSVHIPHGECLKWAFRSWTLLNTAEKILATIPGKLRPIRHQRRPDSNWPIRPE